MNIKRLLAFLLAMMLVLGLCACGQSEEPAGTNAAPGQAQAPTQEQTEAPTQEQTEAPTQEQTEATTEESTERVNTNPVYTVKIVDEAGNPIAGALIQICQGETCMPGPLSGSDGIVTFQVEEADYKVSFLGGMLPAGYEYTTEETEFHFENYEVTIVLKAVA